MTAFFIAAFLLAFGALAGQERLWALAHADGRIFFAGAALFALLGVLSFWRRRLPFARKHTGSRFETWLATEAPLGRLFRGPVASVLLPLMALIAAACFYQIRMRFFAPPPAGLGDSLLLLEHVPVYARLFGYLDSFDELLALWIRSKVYLLGADFLVLPIESSYALLSSAAGGLYFLLVVWFLKGRSYFAVGCGLALFLFSPAVQLYAGYVENYTIASLLLSALLFLAGREFERGSKNEVNENTNENRRTVFLLAGLAAAGVLVHGVVAFIGPALIYFAYRSSGGDWSKLVGIALRSAAVALALIVPVWIYFFIFAANPVDFLESFAYHPALYPPRRWFTADHLGPLLNLPLLVAPAALCLFWIAPLISSDSARSKKNTGGSAAGGFRGLLEQAERWLAVLAPRPVHRFYLLATATFAAHAFVWNPLIGFPADWDLFTFFQGPLHCFAFYRFIADPERPAERPRPVVLLGLLFVSLAAGGGWLARNAGESPQSRHHLERAHANVNRFLDIVDKDELLAKIEDPRRRKKYVKGLLFVLRSREYLGGRSEPAARGLEAELGGAWQSCQAIMLVPPARFQEAFPAAWQDLTRVNIRIEEFKSRLRTP